MRRRRGCVRARAARAARWTGGVGWPDGAGGRAVGPVEVNDMGEDPLVAAAADGAASSDIRMLVAAGAAVNGADGASGALIEAATYGHVDVIVALMGAKAALNAPVQVLIALVKRAADF